MVRYFKNNIITWQLFGHVHGNLDGNPALSPNQFDVGVDSHDFTPISYERVKEIVTLNNLAKIKKSNG